MNFSFDSRTNENLQKEKQKYIILYDPKWNSGTRKS